jgi:hypothetical protein
MLSSPRWVAINPVFELIVRPQDWNVGKFLILLIKIKNLLFYKIALRFYKIHEHHLKSPQKELQSQD